MGDNSSKWWRPALALSSTGVVLVCSIMIGFFLGNYLDDQWGTAPWLMVSGMLLGVVAGFTEMFVMVRKFLK